MPVISVINQKGGCGKTTTAVNLAACLGRLDRRVLLVDLDPQGHASLGLNIKPEYVTRGMTEVLTQGIPLEDVIHQAISPNLDVAPANITLSTVEQLLADATHKERRLIAALDKLKRTYDYVIIDSPPSLGILTFNALRASTLSIVPIDMGIFSLHGLARLKEIIDVLARHTGHQVQIRALGTMVNLRARFAQEVIEEIKRHFGGNVFGVWIRNNVRLREAASHGLPVTEYDPASTGAQDYQALAQEVIALEAVAEPKPAEVMVVKSAVPSTATDPYLILGPIENPLKD